MSRVLITLAVNTKFWQVVHQMHFGNLQSEERIVSEVEGC